MRKYIYFIILITFVSCGGGQTKKEETIINKETVSESGNNVMINERRSLKQLSQEDTSRLVFSSLNLQDYPILSHAKYPLQIDVNGERIDYYSREITLLECPETVSLLGKCENGDIIITRFEAGDSEIRNLYVVKSGIFDVEKGLNVSDWEDLGSINQDNADYKTFDFEIYSDCSIYVRKEERKEGITRIDTIEYRIDDTGRFYEIDKKNVK